MNKRKLAYFFILGAVLSPSLNAKPDVFFADSDTYNGAYLRHEFSGDGTQVKFVLTKPIAGINLPNNFYNFDQLKNYISNTYLFPSVAMQQEFEDMMAMSFESRFRAKEFLEELLKVLAAFR